MKEKIYEFTATLDNVEIGAGGIEDAVIAACAKDVTKRQGTYKITVVWCDGNFVWACNECGSREFNSNVMERDLDSLACSGCGCNEFHKEPI